MAPRRTLALSDEQRWALLECRDHDRRPYVRERCAAMLKIADGQSAHHVALNGLLRRRDPDTMYGWLAIYQSLGLAGLIERSHGGARRGRL